jgi:hypothetical protein
MDVVYSLTCHEEPEGFIDLLKNILYYNKNIKVGIIIHANDYMFSQLNGKFTNQNIFLNNKTMNRSAIAIHIFQSHIENCGYLKQNNISYRYFIPLASNCYFHKFVDLEYIKNMVNNSWNFLIIIYFTFYYEYNLYKLYIILYC